MSEGNKTIRLGSRNPEATADRDDLMFLLIIFGWLWVAVRGKK